MLVFKVVGTKKTFKIPQEWGEIKLQDYALFIDTITTLQNKLKEDEKEDCGLYEDMAVTIQTTIGEVRLL